MDTTDKTQQHAGNPPRGMWGPLGRWNRHYKAICMRFQNRWIRIAILFAASLTICFFGTIWLLMHWNTNCPVWISYGTLFSIWTYAMAVGSHMTSIPPCGLACGRALAIFFHVASMVSFIWVWITIGVQSFVFDDYGAEFGRIIGALLFWSIGFQVITIVLFAILIYDCKYPDIDGRHYRSLEANDATKHASHSEFDALSVEATGPEINATSRDVLSHLPEMSGNIEPSGAISIPRPTCRPPLPAYTASPVAEVMVGVPTAGQN